MERTTMSDSPPVLTHGVSVRSEANEQVGYLAEEIKRKGYAIIPNVFSVAEMKQAREYLYTIYEKQVSEVGGIDVLKKINDANIVRSPLVYNDIFVSIAANKDVLKVVRKILGNNVSLSSQVGILNRPKFQNYQEAWHRELQYQHFTSSKPLAIQSLVAIDDFTPENGGTFFLAGSHLFDEFPSDQYVRRNEIQVSASAGSTILFDSMVYHRGAANRTQTDRVAINNLYTLPIIHQQVDLARMLNGRFSTDPTHRQLFGYEWNPAENIKSWRMQRVERAKKQ